MAARVASGGRSVIALVGAVTTDGVIAVPSACAEGGPAMYGGRDWYPKDGRPAGRRPTRPLG
jgi:hypothetical protein